MILPVLPLLDWAAVMQSGMLCNVFKVCDVEGFRGVGRLSAREVLVQLLLVACVMTSGVMAYRRSSESSGNIVLL